VELDAEHRPLVSKEQSRFRAGTSLAFSRFLFGRFEEETMGKGILLWLLGVPIPVIILLWLVFGH
jgi:hypothetical protein